MSNKINRAKFGPSWTEVVLGAVLSVLLGIALGAAVLIRRPVITAKELPKEEERVRDGVYYVEGSRDAYRGRQALAKRKAFAAQQSVTVNEDELNLLVTAAAASSAAAAKAGQKDAPPRDAWIAPGVPNLRIRDGVLQVGVPVTINALGLGEKLIVQARGGFAQRDGLFVYDPEELYIGSLPVQRLPFLPGYVRNKLLAAQAVPEDIAESWRTLDGVTIEGNTLKLAMP